MTHIIDVNTNIDNSPLGFVTISTAYSTFDRENIVLKVTDTNKDVYILSSDRTHDNDRKVTCYAWIFGAASKSEYQTYFK